MSQDDTPKLHIDSDWKEQAQAEKERLAAAEEAKAGSDPEAPQGLPEASFRSLVGILVSQAISGLGGIRDPQTGGVMVDLEGSKFAIDLLAVIQEKTEGNLTEEESSELTQVLQELRSQFVQFAQLVAQQQAAGAAGAGAPGMPGPGPIVTE